jgi:hypothetical protein
MIISVLLQEYYKNRCLFLFAPGGAKRNRTFHQRIFKKGCHQDRHYNKTVTILKHFYNIKEMRL